MDITKLINLNVHAVDQIKFLLYTMFSSELLKLNIGYDFDEKNIGEMMNLINFIDYVESGNASTIEIISMLQKYE